MATSFTFMVETPLAPRIRKKAQTRWGGVVRINWARAREPSVRILVGYGRRVLFAAEGTHSTPPEAGQKTST
jgi:hypothetical protein